MSLHQSQRLLLAVSAVPARPLAAVVTAAMATTAAATPAAQPAAAVAAVAAAQVAAAAAQVAAQVAPLSQCSTTVSARSQLRAATHSAQHFQQQVAQVAHLQVVQQPALVVSGMTLAATEQAPVLARTAHQEPTVPPASSTESGTTEPSPTNWFH
jgi:hypothetical protein